MASTHSAARALGAALSRFVLRVTFVSGLLVTGWLLGSAPGMAVVPEAGPLDSPLSGQQDESPKHDSEATAAREPTAPATTSATDVVDGLAGSVGSTAVAATEQDSETTSGAAAPADETPADQYPAHQSSPAETTTPSEAEPPEPVTELAAELAGPAAEPAVPVTELAEPVTRLAEPALERAVALTDALVELTGAVVGSSGRPALVESVISSESAAQPAVAPPGTTAGTVPAPYAPVPGSLATDIALPGPATAVPASVSFGAGAGTSAAGDEPADSTVDDLIGQVLFAASPYSPGASSAGGSGGAPAVAGSNGALTPPAAPAGALVQPPVTVAPGLLAQRPSTSPD